MRAFTADDAVSVHELMAAMPALLSGKFDDRIAELKQQYADIDEKIALLTKLDSAQSIIESAAAVKADADASMDESAKRWASVNVKEAGLSQREQALSASQSKFNSDKVRIEADLQTDKDSIAEQIKMLNVASRGLKDAQDQLGIDRAALTLEKAAFQAKLKALAE